MDSYSDLRARIASALVLVTALCAGSASVRADTVALAGKVVSVDGKVLIRTDDSTTGAVDLKPGADIKEGDVINTASNGKVKLLLEDKTILDLGSSALFKVQKFQVNHGGDRQVDLSMPYGTIRTSVSKAIAKGGKFQIRTRTATMGVRGTEFIVQAEIDNTTGNKGDHKGDDGKKDGGKKDGKGEAASSTKITVVQGKVEVASQKPSGSEGKQSGDSRKLASSGGSAPVMLTAGKQLTASSNAPMSKPVTLTAAALSSVSSSTKLVDNTFQKAVNLNLSADGGSGSGSSDSSAGQATRSAIQVAISGTAPPPPGQIPAMPTAPPIPKPIPIPPGGFSHIHVVVK